MKIPPVFIDPLQPKQSNSSSVNKGGGSFDALFSQLVSDSAPTNPLFTPPLSVPLSQFGQNVGINPVGGITGISPPGRNMALSDPESAYEMMSLINNCEVLFKAQFSELSRMRSSVSHMQQAGQNLGGITVSTDNDRIQTLLQSFVSEYNSWVQRFNPAMQQGGVLAGTQAAQVSRYELEQSISNRFFGAGAGLNGLGSLGITIDPATGLATLDVARLSSQLSANKQGVVATVQEFSANFVKSASLLNSSGNFIERQIDNLDRAIDFIRDNKTSLQAEFGTGDEAKPSGQVAQALAEYNRTFKT
ncbi:MAG TPA: hypothetical protein DFK12_04320 [Gallionellaceae bacterium]|nr:hypothetical protein [Gallionellaceae bacterium]